VWAPCVCHSRIREKGAELISRSGTRTLVNTVQAGLVRLGGHRSGRLGTCSTQEAAERLANELEPGKTGPEGGGSMNGLNHEERGR
jgi:hypothetical protein